MQALGFLALGGEAKVQLLPSPWPSDNLPPPTASLMSIASQRGLLAAAGPEAIVVAGTESIRKAFQEPRSGDSEVRPFRPQLTLPMPMRVSQVAFTADENYLVLSAETGGGLAVYEVQSLLSGSTQRAFEMSTSSLSLRALVPNPTPEKSEFLAIVTTDGKLMIANLKERTFVSGVNGQVLKEGVSCVSWSTKGKQLVAGLGDGSCFQMTPEGEGKGDIPRAPNVDLNYHGKVPVLTIDMTDLTNRNSIIDYLAGKQCFSYG
jgi:nucleoporin NUP159